MMSIEKKAHEAYVKNRELKPKYHIPESCWIDWFAAGYRRAEDDQPKIKPLKFIRGVANTPFGDYIISFNDEERAFDVQINKEWHDSFDSESNAINYCESYYEQTIESLFETEDDE